MISSEAITSIVIAGIGLLGTLLVFLGTRGKTRSDAKAALDARIDERVSEELERVYARLNEVEGASTRQMSAVARVLRSIANQWPDPHGPDLDPRDIAEIEGTIPPLWIRRNRPSQ